MDFNKAIVTKYNDSLTEDQSKLVEEVKLFIASDKLSFTISGHAGTGKTYVVKYIIKNLLKGKRSLVTAPTHKAVRVIENFTSKKGMTFHSLHGLRPNFSLEDFNIDNIKFESIGNNKFNDYDIIFVDESSMIGGDLKFLNDTRSKQYRTKIIYIGDPLQLLPVKENKPSDIFTKVDMSYNLTEVVRQHNDSPLLEVLEVLRDDVINNTFKLNRYLKANPTNINDKGGYTKVQFAEFKELVLYNFNTPEFKDDINFCRYGSFTNSSVDLWNSFIRTSLFPTKDILVEGDILISYKTVIDANNAPVIINSNEYKVLNAIHRISEEEFAVYHVELLDLTGGYRIKVSIADHNHISFKKYYDRLNSLHRTAYYAAGAERGIKFKNYFRFKDTHLCMVNFPLLDHKDSKPRGFVQKELYYGYGVTIHKLQGSTITNILMDGLDICYYNSNITSPRVNTKNNPAVITTRNRLLYTGLSRAENKGIIML
jgi:hypothetical protein